ncbi:MAG: hypothetical protein SGPRY_010787, partial [Prymnesium sp.]
ESTALQPRPVQADLCASGESLHGADRAPHLLRLVCPLAQGGDCSVTAEFRFGVERVPPEAAEGAPAGRQGEREACWRATLRVTGDSKPRYLCLIWQEECISPFPHCSQWIRGKILYQKSPHAPKYFACPYRIDGQDVTVYLELEEKLSAVLPPDSFKLGAAVEPVSTSE